jgi:hypothetical protein
VRSRAARVVAALAWVELATAVELLRINGQGWRALWAEDGGFFLPEAVAHPLTSIFRTHSGYFSLICRVMGTVASTTPVTNAALVLNVGGAAVAAVVSVYVYVASGDVLRSTWARALIAGLTVLTPAAVFEVSANSVDLHWYFLFGAFWALWSTTETDGRLSADSLIAGIGAWSSPLTLLFAPLALRRLILGSGWRRWIVPFVYGVGAAAQVVYSLTHPSDSRTSGFYLPDVPQTYAVRVIGGMLVGDQYLGSVWRSLGWTLAFAVGAVAVLVVAYGVVTGKGRRLFVLVAAGYSVALEAASLVLRGSVGQRVALGQFNLNGSRYFFVPVLLLTTAFVAVADTAGKRTWYRVLPAVLVAAAAAANVSIPTVRDRAPKWEQSVVAARPQCKTPDQLVWITVAPLDGTWYSILPCRRLED